MGARLPIGTEGNPVRMKNVLTSNTLFATVMMTRQASTALIIVPEGKDDHFLLDGHVNRQDVLLIRATGGKEHVLGAAEIAEKRFILGVRFVVDADYDRYWRPTYRYPSNVISSVGHDAFSDILNGSPHLVAHVIRAQASIGREMPPSFDPSAIWSDAKTLAGNLAAIRIANDVHSYELSLAEFPLGALSSKNAPLSEMASLAVKRSQSQLVSMTALSAAAEKVKQLIAQHLDLAVGDHDLVAALSRVLRDQGINVGRSELWKSLLIAIACSHLLATSWFQSLEQWGVANHRQCFDCPCAP